MRTSHPAALISAPLCLWEQGYRLLPSHHSGEREKCQGAGEVGQFFPKLFSLFTPLMACLQCYWSFCLTAFFSPLNWFWSLLLSGCWHSVGLHLALPDHQLKLFIFFSCPVIAPGYLLTLFISPSSRHQESSSPGSAVILLS